MRGDGDFDRARPLWEATLIDGLADGGAALLCKVNHALTDRVAGVDIAMTLYELSQWARNAGRRRPRRKRLGTGRCTGLVTCCATKPGWSVPR